MVDDSRVWLEWEEEWAKSHPDLVKAMIPRDPSKPLPSFSDPALATHYDNDGIPCRCELTSDLTMDFRHPMPNTSTMVIQDGPRLWDVEPEAVVHIAGACLTVFGIFMRQRCDWCGVILLEYDLRRIAVPVDQPGPPPSWIPGSLVRVDGNMSAQIVDPETINGEIQLHPDSCPFDPKHQVQ